MSRALSSTFVEAVNAAETDEAFLVLVKIDDADLASPIRVTSDSVKTYSADQDSTTAVDSTSNNNDGTLVNDPQWTADEVTDRIVGALSFDGVDDNVSIPNPYGSAQTTATIEGWGIVNDLDARQPFVFRVFGDGLYPRIVVNTDGSIFIQARLDGSTVTATSAAGVISTGTWHHIAGVFDVNASKTMVLYVDGVEVTSNTTAGTSFDGGTSTLLLGEDSNLLVNLDGQETDWRAWSTARTQQQIQDNMNKRLAGDETGLVGYWRLDDTVNQYQPFPFKVELPDDTDDMGGSLARLRMDAVDRRVVEAVRRVSGVPEVTLEVVLASNPDTVEVSWPTFSLSNARYGGQTIEADLTLEVLDQEPFPGDSMNPALFSGMY